MTLNPVFPDSWQGFRLRFQHGEAVYEIKVENPNNCGRGVDSITLDGKTQTDGYHPFGKTPCQAPCAGPNGERLNHEKT